MNALDYLSDRTKQAVRRGHYRVRPSNMSSAETRNRHSGLGPTHPDRRLVVVVTWKSPWGDDCHTTIPPTDCSWLTPEDVMPLLSHDRAGIREAAMHLLGHLD